MIYENVSLILKDFPYFHSLSFIISIHFDTSTLIKCMKFIWLRFIDYTHHFFCFFFILVVFIIIIILFFLFSFLSSFLFINFLFFVRFISFHFAILSFSSISFSHFTNPEFYIRINEFESIIYTLFRM